MSTPTPATATPPTWFTAGQRLRWYREAANLTQRQLGARTGNWSEDAVRKWESGDRHPTLAQWEAIHRTLRAERVIGNDLYDLTGTAHAVLPGQPVEHRRVAAIRDAMAPRIGATAGAPAATAGEFAAQVAALWADWQGTQPGRYDRVGDALPRLILIGEATVRHLDGDERRDASEALAKLYQLAWSYLRGVGAMSWGVTAADRAVRAAENADRPTSLAAAAWGYAAILSSARDTEGSLDVVMRLQAAHENLGDATDELRAVLGQALLLGSVQAVRLGDPDRAHRMLDRASRIADRVNVPNAWYTAFGPVNVVMHRTVVAMEQARFADATDIGGTIPGDSVSVERTVAHRVHMAHSYANSDNPLAAVTALGGAFGVDAEETRLNRLTWDTVTQLRHRRRPEIAARLAEVEGMLAAS